MKILVTGGDGQLGQSISKNHSFAEHVIFSFGKDKLDIADKNALDHFFSSHEIDVVINCAAFTNVDLCEKMRSEAELVNVTGVKNISEIAFKYNVSMVHISTDFVFSGKKNDYYVETDLPFPINYYGMTKMNSEKAVRDALSNHYIIRTSSMYSNSGHNFVNAILKKSISEKEIFVVDDQISSPTNADDLSTAIFKLINTQKYGTYHVANDGCCSKFEMAKFIVDYCGIPAKVVPCKSNIFNDVAIRPAFSALKCDKYLDVTDSKSIAWQDSLMLYLDDNKLLYRQV